jgi:hypothetical protein
MTAPTVTAQVWDLPTPPGEHVRALADRHQRVWTRVEVNGRDLWRYEARGLMTVYESWDRLYPSLYPLTDVTAEVGSNA